MTPAPPAKATSTQLAAAYLAVSTIWGSTYLAIRIAIASFPPFFVGAARFLVAGGGLYVFLRLRGTPAPTRAQWGSALVTGVLYFLVGNGLVNVAEETVASGLVSILVATMPIWATAIARFAGERASAREHAGIVLGLAGVLVLNLGADLRAGGMGAVMAIVAPMGWAAGSILSKRLPLPSAPMTTASQMITGGLSLAVVSLAMGERPPPAPPASGLLAMAYLAVFGSLIGFSAYAFLLRNTRAAIATSYAYVNPVVAVALGIAFAGERMDRTTAFGATLVLGAVLLVTLGKLRPRERAAAPIAPGTDRA